MNIGFYLRADCDKTARWSFDFLGPFDLQGFGMANAVIFSCVRRVENVHPGQTASTV